MIVAIAIILILIAIKLMYDYRLWLKHIAVNHTIEWWIMVLCCVYSIYILSSHISLKWYLSIPLSAMIISDFIWFFFNGIYNILRGYGWWFTGSGGPNGSKTDAFLKTLKTWQQKVLEIVPLIILIIIYIIFYGQ